MILSIIIAIVKSIVIYIVISIVISIVRPIAISVRISIVRSINCNIYLSQSPKTEPFQSIRDPDISDWPKLSINQYTFTSQFQVALHVSLYPLPPDKPSTFKIKVISLIKLQFIFPWNGLTRAKRRNAKTGTCGSFFYAVGSVTIWWLTLSLFGCFGDQVIMDILSAKFTYVFLYFSSLFCKKLFSLQH